MTNKEHIIDDLHGASDEYLATTYCELITILRGSNCEIEGCCDDCEHLNLEWLNASYSTD